MTATAPPTLLDVVYPVRAGNNNEELRYSLRTIETNYPHAQVWIIGHQPRWLTNIINHIPGNPTNNPHTNVYRNIQTACTHPDTPDQFVIFNDDFFITEPLTTIPVTYRGTLHDHLQLPRVQNRPNHWWTQSLHTTLACLQDAGITEPLSYELHTPLPVDKHLMAETLDQYATHTPDNPPQWRTLYGNLHNIGGIIHPDGKAEKPGPINTPFHSTTDNSWRHFRRHFHHHYPDPSRYERQP